MPDDDSPNQLRDSIEAFERAAFDRARESRKRGRAGGLPPAPPSPPPGPRRWLPWAILAIGLGAIALYLVSGASSGTAGANDRPDSAPPLARTAPPSAAVPERPAASPPDTTPAETVVDEPAPVTVTDRGAPAEPQRTDGEAAAQDTPPTAIDRATDTSSDEDQPDASGAEAATPSLETLATDQPAQPGRFAIQVAAYDRQTLAAEFADRLTALTYPAYVTQATDSEGRTRFRVRIGAYPDRGAAEAAGRRVTAEEGLEWYLVQAP